MDAAIKAIAASGTAGDPAAVAASTWAKMGKAARKPWDAIRRAREAGVPIVASKNPGVALAPLAGPPGILAGAAASKIAQIATGDLAVIRTTFDLPSLDPDLPSHPIDLELHVNPMTLAIGAAAAALVGGALVARINLGVPLIGTVEVYKGPLADEFDAFKKDFFDRRRAPGPGERTQEEIEQEQENKDCYASHVRFNYLQRQGRLAEAEVVREEAKALGCIWAGG
jgi:hypothetical protein